MSHVQFMHGTAPLGIPLSGAFASPSGGFAGRKLRSSGGIEADGQAFDAEDDEAVLGLEVGFGYAVQVREAAQDGGEGDARLQAGQRRTQAKVNPVPEGEVLVRIAMQVEAV